MKSEALSEGARMSEVNFTIDGVPVRARRGQTIIQAAEDAGIYVPRLCFMKGVLPGGKCRVCTVLVNDRPQAACTQPAMEGMVVKNDTPELRGWRKSVLEMLFVEGNHFCMFCEKSGNCELQALGYRFGIDAPRFDFQFPQRVVDASHPDIILDRNRCILCGRCARTSRELDGREVVDFVGRGHKESLGVNGRRLADTGLRVTDRAVSACPVGALMPKRVGFAVPVGKRLYDARPIGSEIEDKRKGGA